MSNTINIVRYNHKSQLGVEDLYSIYSQIFIDNGFKVVCENYLKDNSINIIFDEFTGHKIREDIKDFKKKKEGSIYIVPTEFLTSLHFGERTFNFFDTNFFYKLFFSFLFIFLRFYYYFSNTFFKIQNLFAVKPVEKKVKKFDRTKIRKLKKNVLFKYLIYPFLLFFYLIINPRTVGIPWLKHKHRYVKLHIYISSRPNVLNFFSLLKKLFASFYYYVIWLSFLFPLFLLTHPKIGLSWSKAKLTPLGLYLYKYNFVSKNFDKWLFVYWKIKKHVYEFKRYHSLLLIVKYSDGFIHFHKVLKKQYERNFSSVKSLFINPLIDKKAFKNNFNKHKFGFYLTGTVTSYRHESFEKLELSILRKYNKAFFRIDSFKDTANKYNKDIYQFSYNPGQSSTWDYSSPTRLYRSINFNHSIPIIDKRSFDADIEELAIVSDDKIADYSSQLSTNSEIFNAYLDKIDIYNKKSKKINSVFFENFKEL